LFTYREMNEKVALSIWLLKTFVCLPLSRVVFRSFVRSFLCRCPIRNHHQACFMFCGDDTGAVIGEIGGRYSLFGNAGDALPKYMTPSDMAYDANDSSACKGVGEVAVGFHCLQGNTALKNPMKDGDIDDWDCVEKLWEGFYENRERGPSKESPAMAVLPSWAPLEDTAKYAEILFETFEVPHAWFQRKASASAFASGRPTALVLDSGRQGSSTVPVYEGHVLLKGVRRSKLGGDVLSGELLKAIEKTGAKVRPSFTFRKEPQSDGTVLTPDVDASHVDSAYLEFCKLQIAADAKEYFCTMPRTPFNKALAEKVPADVFELPDGNHVDLRLCRYTVPELLMDCSPLRSSGGGSSGSDSDSNGRDFVSLPELIAESLSCSSVDIRKTLANNCILAGGNNCFKGIQQRLNLECNSILPKALNMRFVTPGRLESRVSAWTGGSILASLGSFQQLWVSKEEYEESGVKVLKNRCWK
jgi:actin-like protein 6A